MPCNFHHHHIHDLSIYCHIVLHDRKIASMMFSWLVRFLMPLLASLVPHNFRRYHKPFIYLPQNSHHTYLLWHFHSHSEIYCHATSTIIIMTYITFVILPLHDHVVDIVFVKATMHYFSYMSLLIHRTILVHRRRHSYRVIFCSSIEL